MPVTVTKEINKLEKMLGNDPEQTKRNRQALKAIALLLEIWSVEPERRKGDIEVLLHSQHGWQWPIQKYTSEELITKSRELGEWLRERRQNVSRKET